MSRWKASGLHLFICVAIAAVALAVMLLVWYPWPLFEAEGGNELVMILVGVDVIIGPLLTLIIFRSGKWGLRFDLAVIGILQLSALAYGGYIVFVARPAFIVFVKDRFEIATAVELEPEALAQARFPEFQRLPIGGPKLVAADYPSDPAEHQKLISLALAGQDLQLFPKYYVPYAERAEAMLAKAKPPQQFRRIEAKAGKVVDQYLARTGTREEDVRCLMLRARRAWVAVVIDARTAQLVTMLIAENL